MMKVAQPFGKKTMKLDISSKRIGENLARKILAKSSNGEQKQESNTGKQMQGQRGSSVIEHLSSMVKALQSILHIKKKDHKTKQCATSLGSRNN